MAEPLRDKFELDQVISLLRELAKDKINRQDALGLLSTLIADTRSDLQGANLDIARINGDLDDASGASHLLNDYQLTTNETAAADLLVSLYLATDEIRLDLGLRLLSHEMLNDIERKYNSLLAWRTCLDAMQLGANRTRGGRATARRKSVQHDEIAMYAMLLLASGLQRGKLRIAIERTDGIDLCRSQINRIFRSYGI